MVKFPWAWAGVLSVMTRRAYSSIYACSIEEYGITGRLVGQPPVDGQIDDFEVHFAFVMEIYTVVWGSDNFPRN